MPQFLLYILKLSVSLAVVYAFYYFVLRRLTFYNWNRWYLVGYSLLSFLLALVDISPVLENTQWSQTGIVDWVPVIQNSSPISTPTASAKTVTTWQILGLIIVSGMAVMLLRLVLQLISFRRLMQRAEPVAINVIPGSDMKLYQVNEDIIPFSFGNSIFINHHLHTKDELREIVWHEFIHVKQKHSFDIIAGELICLLNWFNPFAWLLRHAIRQNLEFIADEKVIGTGVDKREYQYLLLKVIGNKHFSIAPKFNFSSLKKRIAMMNKMKSAGVHILKFLFILPLIAVLLVAFRNRYGDQPGTGQIQETPLLKPNLIEVALNDTVPFVTTPNSKGYFIDVIGVNGECTVVVKDKAGKEVERVMLNQWKGQKKYSEQYGEILLPPPPPDPPADLTPAVPPAQPVSPTSVTAPAPPSPPVPSLIECPVTGVTAPAYTTTGKGYGNNLAGVSEEWDITNKTAVIKLKNGKTEKFDLTDSKEKAAFEKKYGELIRIGMPANIKEQPAGPASKNFNQNINVNNAVSPLPATGVNGNGLKEYRLSGVASSTPQPGAAVMNDEYSHIITGKEDIVIRITRNTTRQELDNLIVQMKEKKVTLDFDDISYNEKGKLVRLAGSMKAGGSQSNFVSSDFESLTLAMIWKGDKVYFKVNNTERSAT